MILLEPSIDSLQGKIRSKYSLVSIAAKRARELKELNNPLVEEPRSKTLVGIALEEIDAQKLSIDETYASED